MREYIMRDDSKALPTRMETIVRCKDCKFLESFYAVEIEGSWFPDGVGCCNRWHNFNCKVDGFCAWGEPRETGLHG